MNKLIWLILLVFMLGYSCKKDKLHTETFLITLQPDSIDGKDAWIEDYPYENYRNRNWGKSEGLPAISWTAGGIPLFVRSLIDFNFDTIPSNVTIDSAKLSLFAHGTEGHGYHHETLGGSNECYIQSIIENWYEDSVTWNTQPLTTDLNQVLIPKSDNSSQDYIRIDITELVKDIYKNPAESFGFMLRLKNENSYMKMMFAASDVKDENKRPKLEIYYSKLE